MRWIRAHLHGSTLRFFIYTLVCLLFLGWLVVRIGNIQLFSHRTEYHALMADVTGLNHGDQVKLAGVAVGQVSSITTRQGLAYVSFGVDHDVKLPADTEVGIRWHNVLGQKYLYLYPSGDLGPYLTAGATIPASHDEGDADLGEFLNALGPVIQSINPAEANAFVEGVLGGLQGNLDQVSSLIDNAATVSDTVGNLQLQVGRVIDNLSVVVGSLGGRSQDLQQVVSNLATISSALASRNDTLDAVVGNFSQVSGEFAHLLSANRGNLDTIISSLQTVASVIHAHRRDLDTDLSTLSAGLEPYTLISSYGQWFDVNVVYQCLADESSCSYQESGAKPTQVESNSAQSGQVQSSSANNGRALRDVLQRVAGSRG
jgi:phospholipid/cholesterol/gamma-HCH transport system substrate-binding protein